MTSTNKTPFYDFFLLPVPVPSLFPSTSLPPSLYMSHHRVSIQTVYLKTLPSAISLFSPLTSTGSSQANMLLMKDLVAASVWSNLV